MAAILRARRLHLTGCEASVEELLESATADGKLTKMDFLSSPAALSILAVKDPLLPAATLLLRSISNPTEEVFLSACTKQLSTEIACLAFWHANAESLKGDSVDLQSCSKGSSGRFVPLTPVVFAVFLGSQTGS